LDNLQFEIIEEFIKSPEVPSSKLINMIETKLENISATHFKLNKLFEMKSFNCHKLNIDFLINHVYTENQRSEEWINLCNKFNINKMIPLNNTINVISSYNLIKGCLMEQFLINNIDWKTVFNNKKYESFDPCLCGLIVSSKTSNNDFNVNTIAPDLLLVDNLTQEIIPIEFKCVTTNPNEYNGKIYREIKLAKKQVIKAIEIINATNLVKSFYGYIVFGYIFNNIVTIKYTKILI
jgi:hypothetical protein